MYRYSKIETRWTTKRTQHVYPLITKQRLKSNKLCRSGRKLIKWRVLTTGLGLGLPAAALLVPLAIRGHEAHQIQQPHGGRCFSLSRRRCKEKGTRNQTKRLFLSVLSPPVSLLSCSSPPSLFGSDLEFSHLREAIQLQTSACSPRIIFRFGFESRREVECTMGREEVNENFRRRCLSFVYLAKFAIS